MIPPHSTVAGVLLALCSTVSIPASVAQEAPRVQRITATVELERIEPLLRKLARAVDSGFSAADAARVAREIDAQPLNRPADYRFAVSHRKVSSTLALRAVVDDLSMVDIDLVVDDPELRIRVQRAVDDATDG